MRRVLGFAAACAAFGWAVLAEAGDVYHGDVQVVLLNARSGAGTLQSVLCADGEDFPNTCRLQKSSPARAGTVVVTFDDVPPGKYAFATFHDENSDGRIRVSAMGVPLEGIGFSKDAIRRYGPPQFEQCAFRVNGDTRLVVKLRYWQAAGNP